MSTLSQLRKFSVLYLGVCDNRLFWVASAMRSRKAPCEGSGLGRRDILTTGYAQGPRSYGGTLDMEQSLDPSAFHEFPPVSGTDSITIDHLDLELGTSEARQFHQLEWHQRPGKAVGSRSD